MSKKKVKNSKVAAVGFVNLTPRDRTLVETKALLKLQKKLRKSQINLGLASFLVNGFESESSHTHSTFDRHASLKLDFLDLIDGLRTLSERETDLHPEANKMVVDILIPDLAKFTVEMSRMGLDESSLFTFNEGYQFALFAQEYFLDKVRKHQKAVDDHSDKNSAAKKSETRLEDLRRRLFVNQDCLLIAELAAHSLNAQPDRTAVLSKADLTRQVAYFKHSTSSLQFSPSSAVGFASLSRLEPKSMTSFFDRLYKTDGLKPKGSTVEDLIEGLTALRYSLERRIKRNLKAIASVTDEPFV